MAFFFVQHLDIRSNFPTNRPFYVINVAMIILVASASVALAPALIRHSPSLACPTFESRVKESIKLVQQVQHKQYRQPSSLTASAWNSDNIDNADNTDNMDNTDNTLQSHARERRNEGCAVPDLTFGQLDFGPSNYRTR